MTSTGPSVNTKRASKGKAPNPIYAKPLPIVFEPLQGPVTRSLLGLLGLPTVQIQTSQCEGFLDAATQSVVVNNPQHISILWQRGFFGKGNLSRSEPSWLARQINAQKSRAAGRMTSEEVTAKRRAERKQFKAERARAMAAAAAEADLAFQEGRELPSILNEDRTRSIPSAATWKAIVASDAQTSGAPIPDEEEFEIPADLEFLQLTLEEAFFLAWGLRCLTIRQAEKIHMSTTQMWQAFQASHMPLALPPSPSYRPDNPFLIRYAAYHHFRSLGWVVKGGTKFCVDYLLYKRGPVFSHAEFAVILCPVYEDDDDRASAPFDTGNANPFSWIWLNTVNRVNSQVQKTLILAYITIPAQARLMPDAAATPACLAHYSVKEVILRRFIPARMRD